MFSNQDAFFYRIVKHVAIYPDLRWSRSTMCK